MLLFWGWQSGLLWFGAVMGVVLESARFNQVCAGFQTEEDFRRVWNLCMLLALALVVYAFATNEEAGGAGGLLHNSAAATTRNVGISAATFRAGCR